MSCVVGIKFNKLLNARHFLSHLHFTDCILVLCIIAVWVCAHHPCLWHSWFGFGGLTTGSLQHLGISQTIWMSGGTSGNAGGPSSATGSITSTVWQTWNSVETLIYLFFKICLFVWCLQIYLNSAFGKLTIFRTEKTLYLLVLIQSVSAQPLE